MVVVCLVVRKMGPKKDVAKPAKTPKVEKSVPEKKKIAKTAGAPKKVNKTAVKSSQKKLHGVKGGKITKPKSSKVPLFF